MSLVFVINTELTDLGFVALGHPDEEGNNGYERRYDGCGTEARGRGENPAPSCCPWWCTLKHLRLPCRCVLPLSQVDESPKSLSTLHPSFFPSLKGVLS